MIERLDSLEGRIGRLIEQLKFLREEVDRLNEENRRLREEVVSKEGLVEEITQAEADLKKARQALDEHENKEGVVKNKLKTILDRIDDIETEMEQIGRKAEK